MTLDAMGCQKEIAERIQERDADYLFVLKANHGKITINLLSAASAKESLRGKRKKAAWDEEYMTRLLTSHFMR